jgi:hypothetical protein
VLFGDDRLRLVDSAPIEPPVFPQLEIRTRIDAVASYGDGTILLSFDGVLELLGEGLVVEDEDILRFDPATFAIQLFFDGSAHGIPAEADLDAVAWLGENGELLLSLDLPVQLGGELLRPSDVAALHVASGAWSIAYTGSDRFAAWSGRDVVALHGSPAGLPTPLFADGFETGSAARWSASVP